MKRSNQLLIVLLVAALAIRLAAGWAWQSRLDGRFGMGDSESYWALALCIADGEPYAYGEHQARAFRTPGYPALLAPILWWAGDTPAALWLARAEAALLGTLAVAAVWWLARLLFDQRAALLAAGLAAFYPGAIVLGALVLSEAAFCPLMLLQLTLWTLACRAPTWKQSILLALGGGLAAGAASLMRPSWLLFTPLAAALSLFDSPRPQAGEGLGVRAGHLRIALLMLLGLMLAMLPWWVRNAWVTGRFVPTTLQVGASLYDGLGPQATGASNMDFVARFEAEQPPGPDFEWQLDRRMRDASLAWAKSHPTEAAQLAVKKFLRMWNVWPNEPQFSSWPIRGVVFFTYTPLLIFAIIGACRTVGRGWPYILCWMPAVYLTALHVVFVSSIRYREPAMLALIVLAAGGMIEIGNRLRFRND